MGKLIAIDGLDASGKETQSLILKDNLEKMGNKTALLSFPTYDEKMSALVKMYLSGEFGTSPQDTNAYAASSFYAVDRYASYKKDWKTLYESERIIIANRYTTANAVHQLSKLPKCEWDNYLDWLWDFEYEKLQIPKPDVIIFLEMLPELSYRLIESRSVDTGRKKDIHELDNTFLENSYNAAMYASEK